MNILINVELMVKRRIPGDQSDIRPDEGGYQDSTLAVISLPLSSHASLCNLSFRDGPFRVKPNAFLYYAGEGEAYQAELCTSFEFFLRIGFLNAIDRSHFSAWILKREFPGFKERRHATFKAQFAPTSVQPGEIPKPLEANLLYETGKSAKVTPLLSKLHLDVAWTHNFDKQLQLPSLQVRPLHIQRPTTNQPHRITNFAWKAPAVQGSIPRPSCMLCPYNPDMGSLEALIFHIKLRHTSFEHDLQLDAGQSSAILSLSLRDMSDQHRATVPNVKNQQAKANRDVIGPDGLKNTFDKALSLAIKDDDLSNGKSRLTLPERPVQTFPSANRDPIDRAVEQEHLDAGVSDKVSELGVQQQLEAPSKDLPPSRQVRGAKRKVEESPGNTPSKRAKRHQQDNESNHAKTTAKLSEADIEQAVRSGILFDPQNPHAKQLSEFSTGLSVETEERFASLDPNLLEKLVSAMADREIQGKSRSIDMVLGESAASMTKRVIDKPSLPSNALENLPVEKVIVVISDDEDDDPVRRHLLRGRDSRKTRDVSRSPTTASRSSERLLQKGKDPVSRHGDLNAPAPTQAQQEVAASNPRSPTGLSSAEQRSQRERRKPTHQGDMINRTELPNHATRLNENSTTTREDSSTMRARDGGQVTPTKSNRARRSNAAQHSNSSGLAIEMNLRNRATTKSLTEANEASTRTLRLRIDPSGTTQADQILQPEPGADQEPVDTLKDRSESMVTQHASTMDLQPEKAAEKQTKLPPPQIKLHLDRSAKGGWDRGATTRAASTSSSTAGAKGVATKVVTGKQKRPIGRPRKRLAQSRSLFKSTTVALTTTATNTTSAHPAPSQGTIFYEPLTKHSLPLHAPLPTYDADAPASAQTAHFRTITIQSHIRTILSNESLSWNEQHFTALWDAHLISIGGVRADRFLAPAIHSFVAKCGWILASETSGGISKIFTKRLGEWRDAGVIDDACIVSVLLALRGTAKHKPSAQEDSDKEKREAAAVWEMIIEMKVPRRGECKKCGQDVEKWCEADVMDQGVVHRSCMEVV